MTTWTVTRDDDLELLVCCLCHRAFARKDMWPLPFPGGTPEAYLCPECRGNGGR